MSTKAVHSVAIVLRRFTVLIHAHLFLLALILLAAPSFADVIVLKDGRRIVVHSSYEQEGK